MPRRSELLEEERNYRLVKREKEESGALVKQALRVLFSQVGVVVLGVITAVLGNVCNQTNSEVSCCVVQKTNYTYRVSQRKLVYFILLWRVEICKLALV